MVQNQWQQLEETIIPAYTFWVINEGLLNSWLLGMTKEAAQPSIDEGATTYILWSSLEEQLILITIEEEGPLKSLSMILTRYSSLLVA